MVVIYYSSLVTTGHDPPLQHSSPNHRLVFDTGDFQHNRLLPLDHSKLAAAELQQETSMLNPSAGGCFSYIPSCEIGKLCTTRLMRASRQVLPVVVDIYVYTTRQRVYVQLLMKQH